jgi:hypothetical protein
VGRSAEEVLGEDRRYRSRGPRSRPGGKRGPGTRTATGLPLHAEAYRKRGFVPGERMFG